MATAGSVLASTDRLAAAVIQVLSRVRGSRCAHSRTTHGRTYDPANPRDRRMLQEDAVDSEYETAKLSMRAKRAAVGLSTVRMKRK